MDDGIVSTANKPGDCPSPVAGEQRSEPTRIAFCITDLDVGGAERMFVELITRLDRQRWEPRVYCLSGPGPLVDRLSGADVPVTCFGAKSICQLGVIWRLATELRRFRPELVQCFLFHANFVGRLAARWAGVRRVVCGIRVAERRNRLPLWLDRLTQGCVDHNVCVSQAVADFSTHEAQLNPAKVSVIPNAVEFGRFATATAIDRATLGFSPDAPLTLFVGRLDPQKAPFVLLEAFQLLLKRHPHWQLLFVGQGPLWRPVAEWIAARKLDPNIRLAGWRSDVPQLLKTADCLALPSLWEGMPNIVLEAMAAGLPVVVSRVEGTDELIHSGETGLLIRPGSVAELEQQIEAVLTDSELSTRLSHNAQQYVMNSFTFDAMIAAYERLFHRLLS